MRVWLVNIGEETPADPGSPRLLRTGILAQRLAETGHEVVWWNATFNHQRKHQRAHSTEIVETPQGYRLVLLYGRAYASNISVSRILSQIENAREFTRLAPRLPRPDVILAGYPSIELAEAAVRYARANTVPVAVDFRDMWPDVILEHTSGLKRIAAMPFIANWRRAQRFIVRNAAAIVGITDAFVDWALAQGPRRRGPLDRAFHLAVDPARPTAEQLGAAEAFWDDFGVARDGSSVVGCFAGTLSSRHDLVTLVRGALMLSPEEKARFKLVICGRGDLEDELRRLAGGDPVIGFAGWRNAAEVMVLMQRCQFGVLPYRSHADFVISYPNKVGEYLAAGLPIMTGLKGQVRTLLAERDLGYFYEESDPASAAASLKGLIGARARLLDQRSRATAAYQDLFESVRIYREFCAYLEALAGTGADRAAPAPTLAAGGTP